MQQVQTERQALERAADILSERGLHKGNYVDPYTGVGVCMAGAIALATGAFVEHSGLRGKRYRLSAAPGDWLDRSFLWGVYGLLREQLFDEGLDGDNIAAYSDDDSTTTEDAVLMLKRAAHRGRNSHV
jgi:hypothetical protein